MLTLTSRRTAAALLAAASLGSAGLAGATLPSVSHAEPVGSFGTDAKSCHLPGGKTIDSGTTGTDVGGTSYQCTNGVACQVEGGRVTTKCSHTDRLIITVRGTRPVQGVKAKQVR